MVHKANKQTNKYKTADQQAAVDLSFSYSSQGEGLAGTNGTCACPIRSYDPDPAIASQPASPPLVLFHAAEGRTVVKGTTL